MSYEITISRNNKLVEAFKAKDRCAVYEKLEKVPIVTGIIFSA
jgi:hypothetical protein